MSNPAPVGQLEDQLRSMILNNVAPSQEKSQQQQPARIEQNTTNYNAVPPPNNYHPRNSHMQGRQRQNIANNTQQNHAQVRSQRYQQQQRQDQTPATNHSQQPLSQPLTSQSNASWRFDHDNPQQSMPRRGNQNNRGNFRPERIVPFARQGQLWSDHSNLQCQYLEQIAAQWLPQLEMSEEEFASKDRFRIRLEKACQEATIATYSSEPPSVRLASFGSLSSGFAMPGSDMDLALVASQSTADLPRLFEKALLELGHGARLLTRTRVPIIKVCESPPPDLYNALLEERNKWDAMTPEEKVQYDQTGRPDAETKDTDKESSETKNAVDGEVQGESQKDAINDEPQKNGAHKPRRHKASPKADEGSIESDVIPVTEPDMPPTDTPQSSDLVRTNEQQPQSAQAPKPARQHRPWFREKRLGPLDFPKSGLGIQCDINFANPLGLHNTLLLRCYSHCDVRVRLMVLFVKAWASRRKVNSGYNGTLSSYGYVLMVLHYLVNVAQPPVCPNLQLARRAPASSNDAGAADPNSQCEGYDVKFWRNETEILALAAKGMLSHNQQPLGALLRGFFHYYAQQGYDSPHGGFMWTQQVLSLRTPGGILSKEAKGWTGAKTTMQDNVSRAPFPPKRPIVRAMLPG